MPTYDYLCNSCGNRFDSFQKISDHPHETCPACGGPVQRLVSAGAGFIMKSSVTTRTACGSDVPCCGRGVPCGKSDGCR